MPAIPEPGLVVYGQVLDSATRNPVQASAVALNVQGGGNSANVPARMIVVNRQVFYVARIPFETRAVAGQTFQPTPNSLALTSGQTPYTRSATCDQQAAAFVNPAAANFTFGASSGPGGPGRGRVERLDLLVEGKAPTLYDSDGDGVPDFAEIESGTNPFDRTDYPLWLSSDIEITGEGLKIKWASKEGKTYTVRRADSLTGSFQVRPGGDAIQSMGIQTFYTDSDAGGPGPYFYWITED
ncbi:MAG TPA: thrombospondin type 3 repeat-containing protein [Verrucomicrobiota bacterium]|nr:thrombospondin type 3 repeat-containing protein [Verrucomicrobiota bacterium]